jgi:transcriptional regulator with XRE-family HTH domain
MEFKNRLRELRESKGETQKDCARELGVEYANYNKWENGKSPNFETLCLIASHFGVSTDYLLGRTDAKKPENEGIVADLGLTEKSIENIKKCVTGHYMIDKFLSHHAILALIKYITAFWRLDDIAFMNDIKNSLGISFHESIDRKTREAIIKSHINELISMILDK